MTFPFVQTNLLITYQAIPILYIQFLQTSVAQVLAKLSSWFTGTEERYNVLLQAWVISVVDLPSAFDTLDKGEDECPRANHKSEPEPLDTTSVVDPPLLASSRFCLVEKLLENDQSVVPKVEVVDLARLCAQNTAVYSSIVKHEVFLVFLEPLNRCTIVFWQ